MTHLNYFSQFGRMTDPGPFADLYADLPADVPSLVKVVQGLVIHVFWAERYGAKLPAERQAEVQLRSMKRRLARTLELNSDPLTVARLNEACPLVLITSVSSAPPRLSVKVAGCRIQ